MICNYFGRKFSAGLCSVRTGTLGFRQPYTDINSPAIFSFLSLIIAWQCPQYGILYWWQSLWLGLLLLKKQNKNKNKNKHKTKKTPFLKIFRFWIMFSSKETNDMQCFSRLPGSLHSAWLWIQGLLSLCLCTYSSNLDCIFSHNYSLCLLSEQNPKRIARLLYSYSKLMTLLVSPNWVAKLIFFGLD